MNEKYRPYLRMMPKEELIKCAISAQKNKKLTAKQKSIDRLFNPDINGISIVISTQNIFDFENGILSWGKNGVTRQGLFWGDNRYEWKFYRRNDKPSGEIIAIQTTGFNKHILLGQSRPIRSDIHRYHKQTIGSCVVCGSKSELVTDHKNDLYNDPRVLNTATQTKEDFQCLCNHCNLLKRQISKKTLETGKRYSALNIPTMSIFGVDFIEGTEEFNRNDINAMVGTYWYDPVAFNKSIQKTILSSGRAAKVQD